MAKPSFAPDLVALAPEFIFWATVDLNRHASPRASDDVAGVLRTTGVRGPHEYGSAVSAPPVANARGLFVDEILLTMTLFKRREFERLDTSGLPPRKGRTS